MTNPLNIRHGESIVLYSSFTRRCAAFFIDIIILGIFGSILGALFFDQFCRLGANGPLLGLPIAWLYFGLQNSARFGGRTPGKRLLQIKVVSEDGSYLSPARSFFRYGVLGVPYFICGPLAAAWGSMLGMAIVSIFGVTWYLTIGYLLLFNRPSRQGLHDLAAKSYVVKTISAGVPVRTLFWKPHIAILGVLILLELGIGGFGYYLGRNRLTNLLTLQKALLSQPNIQRVAVMEGENITMGSGPAVTRKTLSVTVQWNKKPDDMNSVARQVASIVLQTSHALAEKQDSIVITVSYGYNIGIASATTQKTFSNDIGEWSRLVENSAAP